MSKPSVDAAIGLMDGAYFVGRKELLDFFNDLLELNLTRIEQTAPGAIACQVTDYIFPGSIPMSKVNWAARSDYEFIQNYKLLQSAFTKHNVARHVDVDKLIRAKYQDNLEFCQWLKAFFDQAAVHRDDYDATAVRLRGKGGKEYNKKMGSKAVSRKKTNATSGRAATSTSTTTTSTLPSTATTKSADVRSTTPPAAPVSKPKAPLTATPPKTRNASQAAAPDLTPHSPSGRTSRPLRERVANDKMAAEPQVEDLQRQNAELSSQNNELKTVAEELSSQNTELVTKMEELELAVLEIEKERDFYFEKLRNVEVMLQVHQEKQEANVAHLMDNIFKVLYATAEDNIVVDEDGEVVEGITDENLPF